MQVSATNLAADRNGNDFTRDKPPMHSFKGADARVHHEFSFTQESQKAGNMFDSYRPGSNGAYNSRWSRSPERGDRSKRRRDRSRDRDRDRDRGREWNSERDRGRNGERGRRATDFQSRAKFQHVPAHERPILLVAREKTPELFPGMIHDQYELLTQPDPGDAPHKNSDAESVAMDIDSDDEVKAQKPNVNIKEGEEVIKAEEKKLDVIEMIRKAKAKPPAAAAPVVRNEVAENDDFISFGFSDEEDRTKEVKDAHSNLDDERKRRKTGNRGRMELIEGRSERHEFQQESRRDIESVFSHRESFYQYLDTQISPPPKHYGPPGASAGHINATMLPPPPSLPQRPFTPLGITTGGISFSLPPKPVTGARAYHHSPSTGGAARDAPNITRSPMGTVESTESQPSSHGKKRKHEEYAPPRITTAGVMSPEWSWKRGSKLNPYPWLSSGLDHSKTLNMTDWLHKEIIDFISYVSPRRYEHSVRLHVIHEIKKALVKEFRDIDVRVFGSFASRLYLPTADLDLAVISRGMAKNGNASLKGKKKMQSIANILKRAGISKGPVTVIAHARVPIIKFVEKRTGLNVDMSFDNLSGISAINTFQKWRMEFKAFPPLAVLIKHFLDMRELNVVFKGGLGGFSVICMIVSMLQLHPGVASGNLKIEQNLGIGLLEFLKLYGHDFDVKSVGIDVARKAYFKKSRIILKHKNQQDRCLLHIIDPNDKTNNISKASFSIQKVLSCFGQAYDALVKRMEELNFMTFEERKRQGNSILGVILGGNYSSIDSQRETMRRVYREVFRGIPDEEERLLYFANDEQDTVPPTVEWIMDEYGIETDPIETDPIETNIAASKTGKNDARQKEQKKRKREAKGTAKQQKRVNVEEANTSNPMNPTIISSSNPSASVHHASPLLATIRPVTTVPATVRPFSTLSHYTNGPGVDLITEALAPQKSNSGFASIEPIWPGPPPWTKRGERKFLPRPEVQFALQSQGLRLGNGLDGSLTNADSRHLKKILKDLGYYEDYRKKLDDKRKEQEENAERKLNSRARRRQKFEERQKEKLEKERQAAETQMTGEAESGGVGSRTRSKTRTKSDITEKEIIVIED